MCDGVECVVSAFGCRVGLGLPVPRTERILRQRTIRDDKLPSTRKRYRWRLTADAKLRLGLGLAADSTLLTSALACARTLVSTPVGLVDALTVSLVVGEPLSLAMASVSASSTSVVSSPSCAWLLGSAGVAAPRASGRLRGRGIDDVGVGVDCDSQPVTP